MNQDFKKILSFIFLAMAIVLSWEDLKSFSGILSIKNDIAKYSEENARMAGTKEKIDRSISFIQENPEIITKFDIILPSSDSRPNFMSALESIASLNGILIKKMSFKEPDSKSEAGGEAGSGAAGNYEPETVDINFSGVYSALKNFLASIENSLKIMDVVRIDFKPIDSSGENGGKASTTYEFNVTLKTYWQAPENKERIAAFLNAADFSDFSFVKEKQFTNLVSPPGYGIIIDKAVELNNPAPF